MKKIESIQALRAFAAVSVVLSHISFMKSGAYGVDIFFVISGYLMMYSTQNGLEGYWKKKFFRIVPFYWFMTLVTAAAVWKLPDLFRSYEVSGIYLLKSLCFIPYEHSGIRQPILGLGTLNYEILFYLLFFLASKIAVKRKYESRGWICCVLLAVLLSFRIFPLPMPFQFWCSFLMIDFLFGILIYYFFHSACFKEWLDKKNSFVEWASGILIGVIAVFLWGGGKYISVEVIRIFLWGIPSAILFMAVYVFFYDKKILPFFVLVGNISYYIYLTHPYCVRLTEKITALFLENKLISHAVIVVLAVTSSVLLGFLVSVFLNKTNGIWHGLSSGKGR